MITFTVTVGVNCTITQSPITFTIAAEQVNSGVLVPAVEALKYLRGNTGGTALEYVDIGDLGGGDMTKAVYDTDNDGKVNSAESADTVQWAGITGIPSLFTPDAHTHDDRYYTETEADNKYSVLGHNHNLANLTEHSYNSLTDKPTIPDQLSDLTDDTTHRLVTDTEKGTWNGKQDALTFGIADTNKVQINAADVQDNDYAKFTASGLEGRNYAEVLSDIGAAAASHSHSIYMPKDGSEDFGGVVGYSGTFTLANDNDLVTKKYVDDAITAGGGYTDEMAQDAVGAMIDSTLTYTDGTPLLTISNPVTPQATGFTITAGTTPKTLTVSDTASVTGTNTGDQDLSVLVPKSLFDANTIIAANSDNTPAAVTVAEQTLVGRITAGNINALTVAQVRTLLDHINITETILTTNETYRGDTESVTVDTNTMGFGAALCYTSADGHYDAANATDTTKLCRGIAVESGTGTKKILTRGQVCLTTWNWTVNGTIWLSTSDYTLTQNAPSATGNALQPVGYALSADTAWIDIINGFYMTRA